MAQNPPGVFLDANVLYSAQRRSLFINLGLLKQLRVLWSDAVNDEWVRNLTLRRPDLDPDGHRRMVVNMNRTLRSANVTGYEHRLSDFDGLPDLDDRHMAAATSHGQAQIILTYNLRDFPASVLSPRGLAAVNPDSILTVLAISQSTALGEAMRNARRALLRNTPSAAQYLDRLAGDGLPQTAEVMRRDVDFI